MYVVRRRERVARDGAASYAFGARVRPGPEYDVLFIYRYYYCFFFVYIFLCIFKINYFLYI